VGHGVEHLPLARGERGPAAERPGVLAFTRDPGVACLVNLSDEPVALPPGASVLVASVPVAGTVPVDGAAWLAL